MRLYRELGVTLWKAIGESLRRKWGYKKFRGSFYLIERMKIVVLCILCFLYPLFHLLP